MNYSWRPPLEISIAHAHELLNLMSASNLGACAFVTVESMLQEDDLPAHWLHTAAQPIDDDILLIDSVAVAAPARTPDDDDDDCHDVVKLAKEIQPAAASPAEQTEFETTEDDDDDDAASENEDPKPPQPLRQWRAVLDFATNLFVSTLILIVPSCSVTFICKLVRNILLYFYWIYNKTKIDFLEYKFKFISTKFSRLIVDLITRQLLITVTHLTFNI